MGKIKAKIKELIAKFKAAVKKAFDWMSENKELTIVLVPVVASAIGGAFKLGKCVLKTINLHSQKTLRTQYVYDPSTGVYLRLRRVLRNGDAIALSKYRREGLTVTEALLKMELL